MAERKTQREQRQQDIKKALESGGKIMPNNFEAEQAALGCAMIDQEISLVIASKLEVEDFYNDTHKSIFKAIKDLHKDSKSVDYITVTDYLENMGVLNNVGGMAYISSLTNVVPSAAAYNNYVEIVKRESILRQLITSCGDAIAKAYENGADESILASVEKSIFEIAEKGQKGSLVKISDPLETVISKIEQIHNDDTSLKGLKTGFYQIDKATNGLQKSDLIIIAARPGIGKTSLAMNIVSNAAINSGAKCAVFSLEMSKEQLVQRMLFSVANVSMAKGLRGELNENDWTNIWKARKKLKDTEIYIDENALNTPSQVLSKCRKLKREKGLDLIVIDYIGLMKSDEKTESRQNEVASISRQLKVMAKEINVPVLVLCQLNRSVEQRDDGKPGRPVLSDLRDSGSIEQDADMVWFIHRENKDSKDATVEPNGNYRAEIIIAKFRNGQTGSVYLGWDGSRTSFVNLERDANEQSLVNQYEINEEAKKQGKKHTNPNDFKSAIEEIKNEIMVDDSIEGLVPPPEEKMDFSNIEIPSDDELF